uniref:Uncharacterized protein n=1 Tax=Grammatophora oceanica TaxID=210454 RepID=A0A7S1VJ72_9STRA
MRDSMADTDSQVLREQVAMADGNDDANALRKSLAVSQSKLSKARKEIKKLRRLLAEEEKEKELEERSKDTFSKKLLAADFECEDLRKELKSAQSELVKAQSDVEEMRKIVDEVETAKDTLSKQLQDAQAEKEKAKAALEEAQSDLSKTLEDLDETKKFIEQATTIGNSSAATDDEKQKLRKDLAAAHSNLSKGRNVLEYMKKVVAESEKVASEERRAKGSVSKQLADLEDEKEAVSEKLAVAESELAKSQTELQGARVVIQELNSVAKTGRSLSGENVGSDSADDIERLREELEATKDNLFKALVDLSQTRESYDEAARLASEERIAKDAHSNELVALQKEKDRLIQDLDSSMTTLAATQADLEGLRKGSSFHEAQSERESELQSELQLARSNYYKVQSELEEARSMFAEAEKIATDEITLKDARAKELDALRAENEKLEKELASSQANRSLIEAELEEVKSNLALVESKVEKLHGLSAPHLSEENDRMMSEMSLVESKLSQTQMELEETRVLLAEAEGRLANVMKTKDVHATQAEEINAEKEILVAEMTCLRSNLLLARSELESVRRGGAVEKKSKSVTFQLSADPVKKEDVQRELGEALSELSKALSDVEDSRKLVEEAEKKAEQRAEDMYSEKLSVLQEEKDALQKSLALTRTSLAKTRSDLENTRNEVEELENRLQVEKSELQKDLSQAQANLAKAWSNVEEMSYEVAYSENRRQVEREYSQKDLSTAETSLAKVQSDLEKIREDGVDTDTESRIQTMRTDYESRLVGQLPLVATEAEFERTLAESLADLRGGLLMERDHTVTSLEQNLQDKEDELEDTLDTVEAIKQSFAIQIETAKLEATMEKGRVEAEHATEVMELKKEIELLQAAAANDVDRLTRKLEDAHEKDLRKKLAELNSVIMEQDLTLAKLREEVLSERVELYKTCRNEYEEELKSAIREVVTMYDNVAIDLKQREESEREEKAAKEIAKLRKEVDVVRRDRVKMGSQLKALMAVQSKSDEEADISPTANSRDAGIPAMVSVPPSSKRPSPLTPVTSDMPRSTDKKVRNSPGKKKAPNEKRKNSKIRRPQSMTMHKLSSIMNKKYTRMPSDFVSERAGSPFSVGESEKPASASRAVMQSGSSRRVFVPRKSSRKSPSKSMKSKITVVDSPARRPKRNKRQVADV